MTDEQILQHTRDYVDRCEEIMFASFTDEQKEVLVRKISKPLLSIWKDIRRNIARDKKNSRAQYKNIISGG